jgi:hypothetical protein
MPKSYDRRYTDREKEEIKDDLVLVGEGPTATKWGINPGIAYHDFATRLLGRPPEYATKFAHSDPAQLADYIVAALFHRLEAQRDEITRLTAEKAELIRVYESEQKRIKMSGRDIMHFLDAVKG